MNDVPEVRFPEDLTTLEWLATVRLSYSRLNTYELCPAQYFYNYILQSEQLFSPPAVLGNIVHSTMEDHVGDELDLDQMLTSMERHREDYDPEGQIPDQLIKTGKKCLTDFYDRHKDEEFEIIAKEMPFEMVLGAGYFTGFIDIVLRLPNGEILAIDLKTGKFEVEEGEVPTNLQLGIYAIALQKIYPDTPINVELYYMRSGRRKRHRFNDEELDNMKRMVHDRVMEVLEDKDFKHTDNNKICRYLCDFGKTGVCRKGAAVLAD